MPARKHKHKSKYAKKLFQICLTSVIGIASSESSADGGNTSISAEESAYVSGKAFLVARQCREAISKFNEYLSYDPKNKIRVDAINKAINWCNKYYPVDTGSAGLSRFNFYGLTKNSVKDKQTSATAGSDDREMIPPPPQMPEN